MADPKKEMDPMRYKMELKRIAHEEKMKKKKKKREAKMRKLMEKRKRKEAKLRAKLEAKGITIPPLSETKRKDQTTTQSKTQIEATEKLPEAEIITAEADVWTPKSARNLEDIQKQIDRMDHRSIKSLKERYKERYGEDLEVPDIYNTKPSYEIEAALESGEIEPTISGSISTQQTQIPEVTESTKIFGKGKKVKKEKKNTVKLPRKLRFFDYRTPLYLRDKLGATGGKGKRAVLSIIDVVHNIIFTIIIIKIITTLVYVIKDRREEQLMNSMNEQSGTPQPTS